MEDDQGSDQDWLRIAHITRDLKQVAKDTKKPIFINSQADSTTSKKTGPELDNISFSRAVGQDSDVVMALFRDENMIEDNEMKAKILKQREGITGSVMLNWNFDTMDFSPIYSDVDGKMTFDPNKIVEPVKEKKGRYVEL
jgi:replicative DNA helicase